MKRLFAFATALAAALPSEQLTADLPTTCSPRGCATLVTTDAR
jgi:hypothetical protein